jgi:amino acid transporter
VSLGILSLPSVIATVGIAPGIALIVIMAILSGYSGLIFGEFCIQYPDVESFGGVGEIVGRAVGGPTLGIAFGEFLGWGQTIFQIFVMGSHLLTWTIAMNTCKQLPDKHPCPQPNAPLVLYARIRPADLEMGYSAQFPASSFLVATVLFRGVLTADLDACSDEQFPVHRHVGGRRAGHLLALQPAA